MDYNMKNILLILIFSVSLNAQVPNTSTFSLSDVLTEIGISSNSTLADAFTNASSGGFDPTYEGSKDRLSNFRNYTESVPLTPFDSSASTGSSGVACSLTINRTNYHDGASVLPAVNDVVYTMSDGSVKLSSSGGFYYLASDMGLTVKYKIGNNGVVTETEFCGF